MDGQSYLPTLKRGTVTDQLITEKPISDTLETVLAQLSTDQIRFVVARSECATDKEAARAVGIRADTVYHWPAIVRDAVRLMAEDGLQTALHVRRRNLAKAMLVKVAGLDSEDERIKQATATEIIEWELGKATQKQEVSGPDGEPVEVKHELADNAVADILSILASIGALQPGAEDSRDAETQ